LGAGTGAIWATGFCDQAQPAAQVAIQGSTINRAGPVRIVARQTCRSGRPLAWLAHREWLRAYNAAARFGMPQVHGGLTGNEILPTETNRHDARSFGRLAAARSALPLPPRHQVSIGRKIARANSSKSESEGILLGAEC
jgi:hypothetical protein